MIFPFQLEDKNDQTSNGLITALLEKKKKKRVKEILKADETGAHLEINEIKHTLAGRNTDRVSDENISKTEQMTSPHCSDLQECCLRGKFSSSISIQRAEMTRSTEMFHIFSMVLFLPVSPFLLPTCRTPTIMGDSCPP